VGWNFVVSDDLEKGTLGSEEYFLYGRGPKYLQERMNNLDRVEGDREKQSDGIRLSRKRVQRVHFVQAEWCV